MAELLLRNAPCSEHNTHTRHAPPLLPLQHIPRYIAVLLLMMWGFAGAFFTTFKDDPAADGFESLPVALLSMLNYAVRACVRAGRPASAHRCTHTAVHTAHT